MRLKPAVIATAVYAFPVVVSVIMCVMVWRSEGGYQDSPVPFVVAIFIMAVIMINGFANGVDNPTREALIHQLAPLAGPPPDGGDAEEELRQAIDRKAWINNLGFVAPLILIIQQLLTRVLN